MLGLHGVTRRSRLRAATVVAAGMAAVTFGASQASAENFYGWWTYNGIQPSWTCGQTQQVFGDDYARACVSVNGDSAQAILVLNTSHHPTQQAITGNVQDDINAVDQKGEDRTCGPYNTGTPIGTVVCFAHTMTVPNGTDFGAWITLTDNGTSFPDAHLYWTTYT